MPEENIPTIVDPEWSDYVLSQFVEEEKSDGNPTVAGLRRVAELLMGEIVESGPVQVWPCEGNGLGRATVHYSVVFENGDKIKTFNDVADAWHGNSDDQYLVHAVALASTRAEARCLRKALKLRVVSSEELTTKDPSKIASESLKGTDDERITQDQENFIDLKAKQNNINVIEFLKQTEEFTNVKELKREDVSKSIKNLNKLIKSKEIPEKLIGYIPEWRSQC